MRALVWVGTLAWVAVACGGKAQTNQGPLAAAGHTTMNEEDDAPVTSAPSAAGASSVSVSVGVGGYIDEAAGAGGADGVPDFDYVSKVLVECPTEVCAGTVAASDCAALPRHVVRTEEAGCSGVGGKYDRMRTLSFELSATRRKACYYAQANYDKPALLVGAEAWDDRSELFDGRAHVGAGTYSPANCAYPSGPSTLCDLENPANDSASTPGVPGRGCFDAFSGSCEPCCDDANGKKPDCTGKADGYPGYGCTPHPDDRSAPSYCSCSCESQSWQCGC